MNHLCTEYTKRLIAAEVELEGLSLWKIYNDPHFTGWENEDVSIGQESNLPFSPPLCKLHSIHEVHDSDEPHIRTYALKERGLSFTGEDFDIYEITDGKNDPYARVRGALLHLPGKDKMSIRSITDGHDEEVGVLDRVIMARKPTYDIYRGGMDAEKIG